MLIRKAERLAVALHIGHGRIHAGAVNLRLDIAQKRIHRVHVIRQHRLFRASVPAKGQHRQIPREHIPVASDLPERIERRGDVDGKRNRRAVQRIGLVAPRQRIPPCVNRVVGQHRQRCRPLLRRQPAKRIAGNRRSRQKRVAVWRGLRIQKQRAGADQHRDEKDHQRNNAGRADSLFPFSAFLRFFRLSRRVRPRRRAFLRGRVARLCHRRQFDHLAFDSILCVSVWFHFTVPQKLHSSPIQALFKPHQSPIRFNSF